MMKFSLGRLPQIIFAPGARKELGRLASGYGKRALIITGGSSLRKSGMFDEISSALAQSGIGIETLAVTGEPSPELVDGAVQSFRNSGIGAVIAIGGGSVIDAGKAVSAMLHLPDSVTEYLEVVGTKAHDGSKTPFIAVPTTAGTGSEATKNAVLSRTGPGAFKRSLRHENLVPDIALIDPELALACPPEVSAASGLDAFTQLLESYVSTASGPFTDALALEGLKYVKECLVPVCTGSGNDVTLRSGMAFAALASGITLANAGLGVVHGLASPLGALFGIPHGIACGTMLAAAVKATIGKLKRTGDRKYIDRYARIGSILCGCAAEDTDRCCGELVSLLEKWVDTLGMPRLSRYGMREEHFDGIIKEAGNKNNPATLDAGEMLAMLRDRL